MSEGAVSPIIPVFLAEPRQARNAAPTIVSNPRATARYGRDSVLEFYIESYGASAPDTLVISARRAADARSLVVDTITTGDRAKAVRAARVTLPVSKLDLGALRVSVARADGTELDAPTALVNLGVDMPVGSGQELVDAMRYFASESELQRLRSATPANRPAQWAALMRRTDPNPATPDNESLLEYARRLRVAERLFREGNRHGWQTDRGAVVSALGEPDYMTEPQAADSLGRVHVVTWEYKRHRLYLSFSDNGVPGVWKLSPLSEDYFRDLLAVAGPCVGCR
jgi:GWxTD domain-containing protein